MCTLILVSALMVGGEADAPAAEDAEATQEAREKALALAIAQAATVQEAAIATYTRDLANYRAAHKHDAEEESVATMIRRMEQTLASLRNNAVFVPPRFEYPIEINALGRIGSAEVQQILDENRMFITTRLYGRRSSLMLLCRGVSTKELADDTAIDLAQLMEVTGTYRYTTVTGGSNTVYVVEPATIGQDKLDALYRDHLAKRATEEAEAIAAQQAEAFRVKFERQKRTWTDKSGHHSLEAMYDSYVGEGVIRLTKADGSTVNVPLIQLSDADRLHAVNIRREAIRQQRREEAWKEKMGEGKQP